MKPIVRHIEEAGISAAELAAATGLSAKLVKAIVEGNFIPSPAQRQRIAGALGVPMNEISWDHAVPVHHLRGNGPQTGRAT